MLKILNLRTDEDMRSHTYTNGDLLTRLEVLDVLVRDLCNLEKPDRALVVNESTTLHICVNTSTQQGNYCNSKP